MMSLGKPKEPFLAENPTQLDEACHTLAPI